MSDPTTDRRITRRGLGRLALGALAGAALLRVPAARAAEDDRIVTEAPELEPLVQTLQYRNPSPVEGRRCDNCVLYAPDPSEGFGRCPAFRNLRVHDGAWCQSWAPKAS